VKNTLAAARELLAELHGDMIVTSDSLLLALLREDAQLRQRLEEIGLKSAQVESVIAVQQTSPLQLDEPLQLLEPSEQIDSARILDANANRAREALRVLEDYCRFVLDDAFLSRELKKLRHELAEALADVGPTLLLEARDTQHDVGTGLTSRREQERHSILEVVRANAKRLQEALRSLEEYGKIRGSGLGRRLEQIRYGSYTLERAILLGVTARQRLADARLYVLVSGSLCAASIDWTIEEAVAGGAQIVQLREKGLADRELLERARRIRRLTRKLSVLFIMNDRPDLARLAEADGVHLGQDELTVKDARRIMGPEALIGVSTHNMEQVRHAVLDGASYLGIGPTFSSTTKSFDALAGLEFVRQASAETSLPAFAIGGVNLQTIDAVVAAGARRVAVSHAICQAEEPSHVARALRTAMERI